MAERLTTEYRARVYNDDHGYFVEAAPDGDGLGLCQLTYSDGGADAKPISFCISWDMAEALANAIDDIRPRNQDEAK